MADGPAVSALAKAEAIRPISREERAARVLQAFARVPAAVDALVLFDDQFIQYFANFVFHPTERPIALVMARDGERTLFVPRLELEHAQGTSEAEAVASYPEYPGERHPMVVLSEWLADRGMAESTLGVDHDGYPPVMGYAPYPLSRDHTVVGVSAALDAQMSLKSAHEIALVRESARWGARAHRLLQGATRVGLRENEVVGQVCREATAALTEALGEGYRQQNRWISGALAIYRGQIGANSALPHALTNNARFEPGDTLVTGAGADVWGYLSELERTMFLGEPGPEQRRMFHHMINLQDIAFAAIQPGVTGADVDRAVRAYYERERLWPYWRHHVGHSLGQRIHESPFLDLGDPTVLQPGMVLSVEPGLYVPGLGGFRHSDTVLVTPTGIELLTVYPRDLESLVLPG